MVQTVGDRRVPAGHRAVDLREVRSQAGSRAITRVQHRFAADAFEEASIDEVHRLGGSGADNL